MARKPRDYRAEYARQKAKAAAAGYSSERAYKQARRDLGVPRRASPIPRRVLATNTDRDTRETARLWRMRRESKEWSDAHSRKITSRYLPTFTDQDVRDYWDAYVRPLDPDQRFDGSRQKLRRIEKFMVGRYLTQKEWDASPYYTPLRP